MTTPPEPKPAIPELLAYAAAQREDLATGDAQRHLRGVLYGALTAGMPWTVLAKETQQMIGRCEEIRDLATAVTAWRKSHPPRKVTA